MTVTAHAWARAIDVRQHLPAPFHWSDSRRCRIEQIRRTNDVGRHFRRITGQLQKVKVEKAS